MLGIILTVLKYIGIILGILLAVILLLLALILFVPVKYEIEGEKQTETHFCGKAHWLFHIVTFYITYEDDEMKKVLRVFGVPVWRG